MKKISSSDYSLYKKYEHHTTDGDSRWAEFEEIKNIKGYLCVDDSVESIDAGGVPIVNDSENGRLILDMSDTSSIIIGSTRSTKTRRVCFQTVLSLLAADESIICYDPKGEIYSKTSGFAETKNYNIHVLNLREPEYSDSWNMLGAAWRLYHSGEQSAAEEMVNDMARVIAYSNESERRTDPYWLNMTANIFSMLANILLEKCEAESCNIKSLLRLRSTLLNYSDSDSSKGRSGRESLKGGSKSNELIDKLPDEPPFKLMIDSLPSCSIIRSQALTFSSAPDNTRGSALSTFDSKMMTFFSQGDLTNILSHEEIDFYELCKMPSIVYIIAPDEKKTYASIVSQFIKQMITTFIRICHVVQDDKMHHDGKLTRRMNFVLDEFAQIDEIVDFDSICSACLSRNIRFVLILQNVYQLYTRYGKSIAETIIDNCPNMYFFTTNEPELLSRVSALCGIAKNGEPLITPARLRRLDCRNGRVLIINKLHFPYVSVFDDIEKDNSAFVSLIRPPMVFRKRINNEIKVFEDIDDLYDWDSDKETTKGN